MNQFPCPTCGHELSGTEAECPHCGRALGASAKKWRFRGFKIAALVVMVAGVIGVLVAPAQIYAWLMVCGAALFVIALFVD